MTKVNGGLLFAKALQKEGVECVFTLSGGHIMPILYGCREVGIQVIDVRHECAGAYAADAYAKVTGKPGIMITTAGPGVTNATTAMAEAMETGIPIIHIGGGSPLIHNEMGPLQNVDSFDAMSVFSKWARRIYHAHRIPEYVAMAFRQVFDGTPGPVYLEIPADILGGSFEEETIYWPRDYRVKEHGFGAQNLVEEAAQKLIEAKRPAMVIGEAARFSTTYLEEVEKLANYLKIPTYVMTTSRGVFADESKNELFTIGDGGIAKADVILELGVDHSYKIGMGRAPRLNGDAFKIMVHQDGTKIGYNTPADLAIIGGSSAVAKQLLELIKAKIGPVEDSSWVEEAKQVTRAIRAPYIEAAKSEMDPIHPGRIPAEVMKFINEEAQDWHVVCDGGDAASWMDANAVARYPGQVIRYGPLGTIGTGQGFTLGAWAGDKKPVLYYTGDGSFGFYSMEFDTYLRHGVPVVCVISNDSAWGMIKLSEEAKRKDYIEKNGHLATTLAEMRSYEKFAEIWGGVGIKVTRVEDIIPAIRKVRDSGLPGIVNVQCDQKEMSPPTAAFAGVKK